MFFVMKGLLEVIIGAQVVGCVSQGDAFGEMSLFLSQPRAASVQAVTFCDVWSSIHNNSR
jgi:CRP-like cAMP-binding protein